MKRFIYTAFALIFAVACSEFQQPHFKDVVELVPETNEKYIPTVIEYSIGADRLMLAVLSEGFMFQKFKTFDNKNPYLISLVVNVVSFTAGKIINIL